jgi:hypothetical protein
MKTKVNRYSKVDFSSLLPIMDSIHKGEGKLMNALLALWAKQADKSAPMEFRAVFIAFAIKNGYCKAWAGQVARDAGFRVRAERSDKGGTKDKNKPATDKKKKSEVTPAQLAHMAKSLDAKGLKTLITLLVAM